MSDSHQEVMPPAVGPTPMGGAPAHPANLPVPAAQHQTGTLMGLQSMCMTAQPCNRYRDLERVYAQIKVLCGSQGDRYLYSWEANDKKNRRKVLVEGPTIKMANDILRTYGNCFAGVIETIETPEAWEFRAIFIDYETGFNMMRSFRQRRSQATGMRDTAREEDMIFQIGQSKAIRNVTVNALSSLCDFAAEEAKKRLVAWVKDNPQKAQDYIDRVTEKFDIDVARIEAVVGRKRKDWTVPNIARVVMELRGIDEGMQMVDDVYPSKEDAEEVMAEKRAKEAAEKADAKTSDSDKKRQARKKSTPDKKEDAVATSAPEAEEPEDDAGAEEEDEESPDPDEDPDSDPEPAEEEGAGEEEEDFNFE